MRVEIDVPYYDSSYVDPGDLVKIRIGGLGARGVYEGRIARTAYALDFKNRELRAEIDLPNPDGRLRPGHMGKVVIELESRDNVLAIPSSALLARDVDGTAFCFRAVDDHAVRTAISVGEDSSQRIEVLKGLTEGDVVIVNPDSQMRDGQPITIKPASPGSDGR